MIKIYIWWNNIFNSLLLTIIDDWFSHFFFIDLKTWFFDLGFEEIHNQSLVQRCRSEALLTLGRFDLIKFTAHPRLRKKGFKLETLLKNVEWFILRLGLWQRFGFFFLEYRLYRNNWRLELLRFIDLLDFWLIVHCFKQFIPKLILLLWFIRFRMKSRVCFAFGFG